ncbi:serine hydrolase domain-containing protein [Sphingosinicella sp.]|uniref:serine hydrolase domain-containing protein n=1 Tax=Sphingosinicella sp. TaxID=1917971 RepID=UPI004037D98B
MIREPGEAREGPCRIGRRSFSLGLAALPIGLALAPCQAAALQPAAARDLTALVEAERARAGIPALGAAIVTSGGMRAIGVAGLRAIPDGPPVAAQDLWHIGSCTKTFTATLTARLIERGLLRWESTIGEVLGRAMHAGWRDLSLLWLLSHRSGAPNNFDQSLWERMVARGGPLRDQRAWLVGEGMKTPPPTAPHSRTVYSNAGYLIAGAMLERAADRDWESLVREHVFAPLGLAGAGFGAPGTPGRLDQPLGHVRGQNGGWRRIPLGRGDDNPAATGPAGTIHLSLADWSRFVAAHLGGVRGDEGYLSRASWRRLHAPAESGWDYAPGWVAARGENGEPVLRHLGSNGFFVAMATLYPARDRAVLLVTNLGDDAAEPAFRHLLERLQALPEPAAAVR